MVKKFMYKNRYRSMRALYKCGGEATLHDIHRQTSKNKNNGLKIESIYYALDSLDNIIKIENNEEIKPNTNVKITGYEEVKTIINMIENDEIS